MRYLNDGKRRRLFANTLNGTNASTNAVLPDRAAKTNGNYLVAPFMHLPEAQTVDDYESLSPWNIELG